MNDEKLQLAAVSRLMSFFREMQAWETEAAQHHETTDWEKGSREEFLKDKEARRESLQNIFLRYCDSGRRATRLRDQGLSFNLGEPEYDPDRDKVVSVSEEKSVVTVVVQQGCRPNWWFKYELIDRNGNWWIRDNRLRSVVESGPWKEDIL